MSPSNLHCRYFGLRIYNSLWWRVCFNYGGEYCLESVNLP